MKVPSKSAVLYFLRIISIFFSGKVSASLRCNILEGVRLLPYGYPAVVDPPRKNIRYPLAGFTFKNRSFLGEGEKSQITLYHFLSMTAGFDWDETSYSYYDQRNNLVAMKSTPDWLKYLFERGLRR